MARDRWQKIKMLKLAEILRQETDEQHPLKTAQICSRLEEMNIRCDRRTISQDIALLNELGTEVLETWIGRSKAYYVEDRSFSVPELKILIDSVQAASFITAKKTAELTDKIAALGGTHRAEILKGSMVCFNTRKHSNEKIYYNVDALENALSGNKKVIYRYYDIDIYGKKSYRRGCHHYVAEPVAMVFNEDNYYVIVYDSRYDKTVNYRVDRMDGVEVIDENISEKALALRDTVSEYTEQAFKMYGGPSEILTLEFDQNLIGAIYDRFGEGLEVISSGENKATVTVQVQLSPTFWGWLFQFGSKMKIIAPESAMKERNDQVAELVL